MIKLKSILSFKNILRLILTIFVGILCYAYLLEHNWRYVFLSDEQVKKYRISEKKAIALYQLMKDTHELLGKNNINYWIDGGTLLGAVRHQGIIPFDDDLDIGIMHEDEIRLQQILPQFEQLGYTVSYERAYNICKKACLDIFIFHKKQNKFIYTNLAAQNKYPKSSFYDNELYPLKKYKFGSIEVYGPTDPIGNLNRQYPEWDKYAIIYSPHSLHLPFLSNIEKKTKFILTPEWLKPAQPLGPLEDKVNIVNSATSSGMCEDTAYN
ncbi:MAG: LicD family protein [Rickettsia conorii subsp. raoultii]|uniref:LicD family protein n=1 Tax=Rickettsia conorii TaxID=781 RepID=UPI003AEF9738